jgi:hypothetical protein
MSPMTVVGILMKFVFRLYAAHANLGGSCQNDFKISSIRKDLPCNIRHKSSTDNQYWLLEFS